MPGVSTIVYRLLHGLPTGTQLRARRPCSIKPTNEEDRSESGEEKEAESKETDKESPKEEKEVPAKEDVKK